MQCTLIKRLHTYLYEGVEKRWHKWYNIHQIERSVRFGHINIYVTMFANTYRVVPLVKKSGRNTKQPQNDTGVQIYSETYGTDGYWYNWPPSKRYEFQSLIIIIDKITRYVELFPKQEVTAIAAADALWRHTWRFRALFESRNGFRFSNYEPIANAESGIKHHTTILYSKEGQIVERTNEANRHIRNVCFDNAHLENWSRLLCVTERIWTLGQACISEHVTFW